MNRNGGPASPESAYLFVIDGSKARRSALDAVFGEQALVQRCRTVRNVTERITDKAVKTQTKALMHAAYKLSPKDGMQRLKQQAEWLKHTPRGT